jgi:hypothetical protein
MNTQGNISEMKRFYSESVIQRNAELPMSGNIVILKHECIEALPYCSMETGKTGKQKNISKNNYSFKYLKK